MTHSGDYEHWLTDEPEEPQKLSKWKYRYGIIAISLVFFLAGTWRILKTLPEAPVGVLAAIMAIYLSGFFTSGLFVRD